jgi:hypothetical protein
VALSNDIFLKNSEGNRVFDKTICVEMFLMVDRQEKDLVGF